MKRLAAYEKVVALGMFRSKEMNVIVVCSKISIPDRDRTIPDWKSCDLHDWVVTRIDRRHGVIPSTPKAVVCMSVSMVDVAFKLVKRFPGVKLFCYQWDCYDWCYNSPRASEYDYGRYNELLRKAVEIWVPSNCTGEATQRRLQLKNWHTIWPSAPYWEYHNVYDDGYALCALREQPDAKWGWFEKACEELRIPYKMTKHEHSFQSYQETVANCRFLVSPLDELSTGGLTLQEGYYLGKPILLSDSRRNGAGEYFKDRASYFKHDSFADLKASLKYLYETGYTRGVNRDHRQWVADNFNEQTMVDKILARIEHNL